MEIVHGNKENSKNRPNEILVSASGPKVLRAREFGQEITNANSSSTNKNGLNHVKLIPSQVVSDHSYKNTSNTQET